MFQGPKMSSSFFSFYLVTFGLSGSQLGHFLAGQRYLLHAHPQKPQRSEADLPRILSRTAPGRDGHEGRCRPASVGHSPLQDQF